MASVDCPMVTFSSSSEQLTHHGGLIQPSSDYDSERGNSFTPRSFPELEEHEVLTSLGLPQHVFISPNKGKTALITYHDIGTNHTSFYGFFNYPEMRVIARHFTVYHICAPGHHENAPNAPLDSSQVTGEASRGESLLGSSVELSGREDSVLSELTNSLQNLVTTSNTTSYPNLDQMAEMLTSILVHFNIKCFVGFGMGAGSNILARYALAHSDNVLALFLINPTATTHAYYPRLRCRWYDLPSLQRGFLSDYLLEQLESHWFGYGLAENDDIRRMYEELARSLNPFNLAGYIQAYMERTPLNLVRPTVAQPDTNPAINTVIKADVCLVTGDRATDLSRTLGEMNGLMDPKLTQFLSIPDCTGMVMEENPDKLTIDFLHFLHTVGLLINLTKEKLHTQAIAQATLPGICGPLPSPTTKSTGAKLEFEDSSLADVH